MNSNPVCEECGCSYQLSRFAGNEGGKYVQGWACDNCGWSWDDEEEGEADDE